MNNMIRIVFYELEMGLCHDRSYGDSKSYKNRSRLVIVTYCYAFVGSVTFFSLLLWQNRGSFIFENGLKMRLPLSLFTLVCSLLFFLTSELVVAEDNHWILDAKSDKQRFSRIETYLRGFDQPMWEVGDRFTQMTEAVDRSNYPLAIYHWKKIRKTIVNGVMKRPARSDSAQKMLLDSNFQLIMNELKLGNQESAQSALKQAANVCMACHIAEKVQFVNDQKMFDRFIK